MALVVAAAVAAHATPPPAAAVAVHHRAAEPSAGVADPARASADAKAAARRAPPPLSTESPASLGARFAVGLDVGVERLSGLEADSLDLLLSGSGFGGAELPRPLGDLSSLDYETELTWIGAQVPIALPSLGPVSFSLVLEGAAADGDFDLFRQGRTPRDGEVALQPALYSGEGSLLGVGIEAAAPVCPGCGVFVGSGYRFRSLRGLDVSTPVPDCQGTAVRQGPAPLTGEVDRDEHRLTLRVGWQSPGGRVAPYAGVRGHRGETTLGVELAPLFQQVPARARLDLESDDVSGLVGVDVRLGRFAGRLEGTFGGDRETVFLKVVRGFGGAPGAPTGVTGGRGGRSDGGAAGPGSGRPGRDDAGPDGGIGDESPRDETPRDETQREEGEQDETQGDEERRDQEQGDERDWEERRARADRIAEALAPEVRALRSRFQQRRAGLETTTGPRGEEIYVPAGLRDLLDVTEAELLAALGEPELAPLRAWVEVFFGDLGEELPTVSAAGVAPTSVRRAVLRPGNPAARAVPVQQPGGGVRARQDGILGRLGSFLDRLDSRTEAGKLDSDLCLRSLPRPGVEVRLYAPNYPQRQLSEMTERTVRVVYRGLYAYEVEAGEESFACTDRSCPLLDLWLNDGPFVVCDFGPETCVPRSGSLERCERP